MIQIVDPLVKCIMEGALPSSWPEVDALDAIDRYSQKEEKERNYVKNKWQSVELPKGFVRIVSV